MASGSAAFGVKPGYNQSGGGYYVAYATIPSTSILSITSVASGSGGAYAGPTLSTLAATAALSTVYANNPGVPAGRILRDMGKTLTSSTRTFRKFQIAVNTASTGGVNGNVPPQANYPGDVGYFTFYLEVNRDGASTNSLPIARSFF